VPNPYKPPEAPPDNEDEHVDPDWIYRESFAYFILIIAIFYIIDTIVRAVVDT
tara:strand:- start:275 stop:433 length:159 start_codon:yes stop_codon:yes gene_type:complete